MNDKVMQNLFGKELIYEMNELLNEFINLSYDVNKISESLKLINETVRGGIYLLALNRGYKDLADKIDKANKRLNEKRKEDFVIAYKNNKTDSFLALLSKADKIALLSDLGLDVELDGRKKFSKEQSKYYKLITNSIMNDQNDDKREGLDQFIKFKKET